MSDWMEVDYYNKFKPSSLGYWSPMEYLVKEGFIPKTLAENGLASGSVSEVQVRSVLTFRRRCVKCL